MKRSQIEDILQEWKVNNYTINRDMSVSIEGNLIVKKKMKELPFKIDRVSRSCILRDVGLESLHNSPNFVGSQYDLSVNNITILDLPEKVHSIDISENPFKTLKGSPKIVEGNMLLDETNLETLEHGPDIVKENFYITNNNHLTSLKGIPKEIKNLFIHTNKYLSIYELRYVLLCKVSRLGLIDRHKPIQEEFNNFFKLPEGKKKNRILDIIDYLEDLDKTL